MKNIFIAIAFSFLIFNCFGVTAQTKQEQLSGTWVFDYETALTTMSEKAKTVVSKIPSGQEKLEKNYKNRKITFSPNGHYLLLLSDGTRTEGTWTLNGTLENSINITVLGKTVNIDIISLTSDLLILKLLNEGTGTPIFSQWYFKRN